MYFDSSDQEFTTYSEDERYEQYLEKVNRIKLLKENYRKDKFDAFVKDSKHIIFKLQGLNIMKFTPVKIKFCFQPSLLYDHISKKNIFHCSIKYLERYQKWILKREPIPARPLFYEVTSKSILINDNFSEITEVILRIYEKLKKWSEKEIRYRRKKYLNYCAGKIGYLEIDSTDEEIYFTKEQRRVLHKKRETVLKRMITPTTNIFYK